MEFVGIHSWYVFRCIHIQLYDLASLYLLFHSEHLQKRPVPFGCRDCWLFFIRDGINRQSVGLRNIGAYLESKPHRLRTFGVGISMLECRQDRFNVLAFFVVTVENGYGYGCVASCHKELGSAWNL